MGSCVLLCPFWQGLLMFVFGSQGLCACVLLSCLVLVSWWPVLAARLGCPWSCLVAYVLSGRLRPWLYICRVGEGWAFLASVGCFSWWMGLLLSLVGVLPLPLRLFDRVGV